jgi:hypothetical protein
MQPRVGPVLFSVRGISGVAVPNGSEVGPITFQFPRALFVTGLLLLPRSGSQADLAKLQLRIQDELQADMISDGSVLFEFGGLAMHGRCFRPYPLQRPVLDGDEWRFTVGNDGAAPITVATLAIIVEEGLRR